MRRDLIRRALTEFLTVLDTLNEDATIIAFHSEIGPVDSCRISVLTTGIDDKIAEEAADFGEKLEVEEVNTPVGDYTRRSFRCGAVEIVAADLKGGNQWGTPKES